MKITELKALAGDRGLSLVELADAIRLLPTQAGSTLTETEQLVLHRLGIDTADDSNTPVLAGILRRMQLERDTLTEDEVAWVLKCDVAHVRGSVAGPHRTLLGFRSRSERGQWLLPAFQFELGLHGVHGWGSLLQALPSAGETSPTALVTWLAAPRPQLGGRSRAQALAEGMDLNQLLAEASSYAIPP